MLVVDPWLRIRYTRAKDCELYPVMTVTAALILEMHEGRRNGRGRVGEWVRLKKGRSGIFVNKRLQAGATCSAALSAGS